MARQKLALFQKTKKEEERKKIFNHKNSNLCFFLVEMSSQHFLLIIYTIRCYQRRVLVVGDLDDIIIRVGPHIRHSGLEVQKKIRENTWISRLFFIIINFKGNKNLRHISFG